MASSKPASRPSSSSASGARRPRGTGSLFIQRDSAGREVYYGKWRVGSTQVKRAIGLKRIASTREGLTRSQAEAELRRMIGSVAASGPGARVTVQEAGELLLARVRAKGRKRTTLEVYDSCDPLSPGAILRRAHA